MLTEQGVFNLGFFKQRYVMCENQEPDFNPGTSTHQSYLFNGIKGNFIGPWAWSNGSRDYRYHLMWLGYFRHSIFRFFLVFLAISFQADAIFFLNDVLPISTYK